MGWDIQAILALGGEFSITTSVLLAWVREGKMLLPPVSERWCRIYMGKLLLILVLALRQAFHENDGQKLWMKDNSGSLFLVNIFLSYMGEQDKLKTTGHCESHCNS